MVGSEYDANSTDSWTSPAKRKLFRLVAVELWFGNVFLEYTESLYICGHNSEQHSLPQHRCRSRALVYGCNVILWRWHIQQDNEPCHRARSVSNGFRNINQSLTCFYGQISLLTSIIWSICGTKSKDHFSLKTPPSKLTQL
ncbi:hypothetical protein AVEN_193237-1 [Araneus ventricosus]|uniref:Uncharacterized protein n=1 Tax=Araneus ventricosus TaxID=182803 RepID=A0A4Y2VNY9_ARAVE|nr:hypothetical protein AVEN_193237-1 [Araneus ventricosus]